jgi:threonine dehydrogenase-like Zn-dependent dehydrogenase
LAPLFFCGLLRAATKKIGADMRIGICALLVAGLLGATSALAADDSQNQAALAPGGAAGVERAQEFDVPLIVSLVGVVGVGIAVVILVSNSKKNSSSTATSSP